MRQSLRKLNGLLQQRRVVVTVEQKAVGIVVVQEQHQLEVLGILGEVFLHLALQRRVALDAAACMHLLQQNVAIGKVQHAVQRSHIVGLHALLAKGLRVLSQKLVQPFRRFEVQLAGQLRTNAERPHLAKHDDVAANGLHSLAELLQETVRLTQRMVDAEGIHTHADKPLGLVNHETSHLGVRQIELRQVAEA